MGTTGNSGGSELFGEDVLPMSSPLHPVVDNQLHDHVTGTFWSVTDIFTDLSFPFPMALDPFLRSTALPADMAGGTRSALFLCKLGRSRGKSIRPPERRQRLLAGCDNNGYPAARFFPPPVERIVRRTSFFGE